MKWNNNPGRFKTILLQLTDFITDRSLLFLCHPVNKQLSDKQNDAYY